jgi:iron complex transport system substrate-binding protein
MARAALVVVLALCCGACNRQDSLPQYDARTHNASESVAARQPAHRIIALAPNLTELVYAAGAGDRLVGTVDYADYPEAAKSIAHVGDALHVDMEKLLSLKPDLILVWPSGTLPSILDQVRALHVPVKEIDAQRIAEISRSIREIGESAGTGQVANQVADDFEHEIGQLRQRYAAVTRLAAFIEVNREPIYTVNSKQIISEVVELCGGDNVFADLNQLAPMIGVEAVIAKDPEVILGTDGTTQQLQSQWNSWPHLRAVKLQHIYAISPDTINRAAPRIIQGIKEVCEVLDAVRPQHSLQSGRH